jgi:Protein of unknown function (DUF3303)
MLFMIIERFKPGGAPEVYGRFRARGRMAPEGLHYIASWVDLNFERCFQVMETNDESLVGDWIANWSDLVEFEVVPVRTSAEAAAVMLTRTSTPQSDRAAQRAGRDTDRIPGRRRRTQGRPGESSSR